MAGMSDYTAQNVLNYISGQVGMPTLPAVFMALFTAAPTSDAGTGGTEVSGGAYARQQVAGSLATNATTASGNNTLHFASTPAWIVAGMSIRDLTSPAVIPGGTTVLSTTSTTVVMSGNAAGAGVGSGDSIGFSAFTPASASSGAEPATTPAQTLNANTTITFAKATANWGTAIAFGLYDAVTAGNMLGWDYLGGYNWLPFTATSASPSVLTSPGHGYANNDAVVVTAKFGGALPPTGGSWAGLLTVASATTDTFTAGVNTTATGDGLVRKVLQQSIPINVTASFASSQLVLTLA